MMLGGPNAAIKVSSVQMQIQHALSVFYLLVGVFGMLDLISMKI